MDDAAEMVASEQTSELNRVSRFEDRSRSAVVDGSFCSCVEKDGLSRYWITLLLSESVNVSGGDCIAIGVSVCYS